MSKEMLKYKKSSAFFIATIVFVIISFSHIISAQGHDIEQMNTCLESKDGKFCQEYSSDVCDDECAGSCIPSSIENVGECRPGTCFDPIEGDCLPGSPKVLCEEDSGGKWFDDPLGNVPECEEGCCVLGEQTSFIPEQKCRRIGDTSGIIEEFRPEINTALGCLSLSRFQVMGSCVFEVGDEKTCRFTTEGECIQSDGEFFEGFLCSNANLNTECEKQQTTSCVEGREEIYWFDSCGNRENIYEGGLPSQKEYSWNNGRVLAKKDACSLGTARDPSANQGRCGNCNYISGSICGEKTATEKLIDPEQDVVCRSLNCIDEKGNKRLHGESWCVYQSSLGPKERNFTIKTAVVGRAGEAVKYTEKTIPFYRGSDTPGSRHFRKMCIDGEIVIEPCMDYRDEICIQSEREIEGEEISFAQCKLNRFSECFDYNEDSDEFSLEDCQENPYCFVKEVDVPDTKEFHFNVCVPKYPPGIEYHEAEESVCDLASLQCQATRKTSWFGISKRWRNKGCLKQEFTRQMHDFCMSLGDCGASVNYVGNFSNRSYRISGAPALDADYINGLLNYSNAKDGEFIEISEEEEGFGSLRAVGIGIPKDIGRRWGIHSNFFLDYFWGVGTRLIPGFSSTKYYTVKFTCRPWKPKLRGEKCGDCGKDENLTFPCSKYACESLGTACEFINEGTSEESCIWVNPDDVIPPVISPLYEILPDDLSYEDVSERGFTIESSSQDGCIQEGTDFTFGISLDEPGKCVIQTETTDIVEDIGDVLDLADLEDVDFETYETDFGDADIYKDNHTQNVVIPSLQYLGISGFDPDRRAEFSFSVKCEDRNENVNPVDYVISMCISPGKHLAEPEIIARNPVLEFVRHDVSEQNASVYVFEPAECKWSRQDKDYNEMENEMNCSFDPEIFESVLGWKCDTTFPIEQDENIYYVRCKDQPWLAGTPEEEDRNTMTSGYDFVLKRSGALEITSISPQDETLILGTEPATVAIEVETSGGIDNGISECSYLFEGYRNDIAFAETLASSHSQIFNALTEGDYEINIKCEDEIENTALGNSSFIIEIDNNVPIITRLYEKSGDLIVITNEPSECYYNKKKCNFDITNATESTQLSGTELVHTTSFDKGVTYHIKCEDIFNNVPGDCSAIAKYGE